LVLNGLSREDARRVLKRINEDVGSWIKRGKKDSPPAPRLIFIENIKDPSPRAQLSIGDPNTIKRPMYTDIDDLLVHCIIN
jgi:hypothetical protein